MLYYLFTDQLDLLLVKNKTYSLYIKAFQACKQLHTHPQDFYTDLEEEGLDSDSDSGDKDPQEEAEDEHPLTNFEAFTHQ